MELIMQTFLLISTVLLWTLTLALGFLLFGTLRSLGILQWQFDELQATRPVRKGREGLAPIKADGVPFDPAVHEAVGGGGSDDLVVSQELRRGYMLRERVLRPTLVMVAPAEEVD